MVTPGPDLARRFGGIARLYGEQALARFAAAQVCVIGVGGAGSWAVEALARSGIGADRPRRARRERRGSLEQDQARHRLRPEYTHQSIRPGGPGA